MGGAKNSSEAVVGGIGSLPPRSQTFTMSSSGGTITAIGTCGSLAGAGESAIAAPWAAAGAMPGVPPTPRAADALARRLDAELPPTAATVELVLLRAHDSNDAALALAAMDDAPPDFSAAHDADTE